MTVVVLALPAQAQLATPNESGITYGHVHLNVSDIEVHKKLWVDFFGGVVVQKGPLTAIRLPNLLIALTEREPTGPMQGSVLDHFGFKVRNTDEFVAKWRAAGMEVGPEFTGAEGMPNAYVMVPDGVWVELQEDPSLHVPVAGYHIHFLTPDYEELLDWYTKVFSLTRRSRGQIQTTTDVPGMNMSFGNAEEQTVATRGRALDHIGFRGRRPRGVLSEARGDGNRVRRRLSRGGESRAEDCVSHRSRRRLHRADRRLRRVLRSPRHVPVGRGQRPCQLGTDDPHATPPSLSRTGRPFTGSVHSVPGNLDCRTMRIDLSCD